MSKMNITANNISGNCTLKCAYSFKYESSSCLATNMGNYIKLNYDRTNTPPVTYNTNTYYVDSVCIYAPSIHLYNNSNSDAEIVIKHVPVSSGPNFNVSIPIIESSNETNTSMILSSIIDMISKKAPNNTNKATIPINTYNLQNIVPKQQYFSYSENNNSSNVNWIVFSIPITLSNSSIKKLNQIIKPMTSVLTKNNSNLFINTQGPGSVVLDNQIYIDCKPVGESEETINIEVKKTNSDGYESFDDFINNPFVISLIAIIIFIITIYIANMLISYIKSI